MTIPGKNWVVGLLAVVAVGMVASQFLNLHKPHFPPSMGAPPAAAPVSEATPSAQPLPVPALGIDRHYAESNQAGWMNAPVRDPFLLLKPVSAQVLANQMNQLNQLKLKGIWRQNGVSLAAINHGVYRLGDVVNGCQITSIDGNGVWLENHGQKGFLGFKAPAPLTAPRSQPPP